MSACFQHAAVKALPLAKLSAGFKHTVVEAFSLSKASVCKQESLGSRVLKFWAQRKFKLCEDPHNCDLEARFDLMQNTFRAD